MPAPASWPHSPLGGLAQLRRHRQTQFSSYDTKGGNRDYVTLAPGEARDLCAVSGAGVVRRLWFTLFSADPYRLRTTVLRCTWDGADQPSVEAPLGDFFGAAFAREPNFSALPFGVSSGGYYSYWPMPFARGAQVQVINDSPLPLAAFYYHVTVDHLPALPPGTGRFHARFTRATTKKDEDFCLLDTTGEGHYAGCFLAMQGRRPFHFWFLEGDERLYVDGEDFPPAIHGTGTEDYFNGAWYFRHGPFTAPGHGVTVKDPWLSRVAAFRAHLEDPVPFSKSIRVCFEHGGVNDMPGCDYSAVAWWYAKTAGPAGPPLPPVNDRLPHDPPLEKFVKTQVVQPALKAGLEVFNGIKDWFYPKY